MPKAPLNIKSFKDIDEEQCQTIAKAVASIVLCPYWCCNWSHPKIVFTKERLAFCSIREAVFKSMVKFVLNIFDMVHSLSTCIWLPVIIPYHLHIIYGLSLKVFIFLFLCFSLIFLLIYLVKLTSHILCDYSSHLLLMVVNDNVEIGCSNSKDI